MQQVLAIVNHVKQHYSLSSSPDYFFPQVHASFKIKRVSASHALEVHTEPIFALRQPPHKQKVKGEKSNFAGLLRDPVQTCVGKCARLLDFTFPLQLVTLASLREKGRKEKGVGWREGSGGALVAFAYTEKANRDVDAARHMNNKDLKKKNSAPEIFNTNELRRLCVVCDHYRGHFDTSVEVSILEKMRIRARATVLKKQVC
ncbi:hypothetical protein BaRGS_00001062 [Batillaria attramentaria]|uniref:Uncharacterized protein n=1 Tax=Batillaria attramentaria TaxID=370345 RepID=A0ABD0M6J2_9CAEN